MVVPAAQAQEVVHILSAHLLSSISDVLRVAVGTQQRVASGGRLLRQAPAWLVLLKLIFDALIEWYHAGSSRVPPSLGQLVPSYFVPSEFVPKYLVLSLFVLMNNKSSSFSSPIL